MTVYIFFLISGLKLIIHKSINIFIYLTKCSKSLLHFFRTQYNLSWQVFSMLHFYVALQIFYSFKPGKSHTKLWIFLDDCF